MAVSARRSSRFSMRSKQIGQLLIDAGEIQVEHVNKALKTQEQEGGLLGQILQRMGVCTPEAVGNALLKQVQVTDIQCEEILVHPETLDLVPREQCDGEKLCPFEQLGNLLCIVMGNPLNRRAINAIEETTRLKVKPFKAPWPKIKDLLERSYAEAAHAQPAAGDVDMADDAGMDMAPSLDQLDEAPAQEEEPGALEVPAFLEEAQAATDSEPEALPEPEPLDEPEMLPEPEPLGEPEPLAEPEIEGLDNLDEANAEVIETDARGLARKRRQQKAAAEPFQMPKKEAKVNVDLDSFDAGAEAEVVEGAEEALPVVPQQVRTARKEGAGPLPKLTVVETAYFYAGEAPKEDAEPNPELAQLIDSLPVAETVADSIAAYHRDRAEAEKKEEGGIPVEATKVPDGKLAALALSENDFQELAAGMQVDRSGEWLWQYTAEGPVPVLDYQTEG